MVKNKYQILYADCPWKYQDKLPAGHGGCEEHYPTMSLEDIMNLPIGDISAENSVLFLWTTFPFLKDSLRVIEAWGFNYKTIGFLWVKRNKSDCGFFFGLGRWSRGNAEPCLLATRGKPKRINNSISQLVFDPITRHSRKPIEVKYKIVELIGDLPRIELFAREKTGGWDVWGNEVDNDIVL